jgi:N-methylhydantoinase A/oxoprolinase/acetone carboxylase beta subunit
MYITLSHKLSGRLGLLEREAAAVINASLAPLAAAVIPQYTAALQQLGLHVPLYITGTL